jgi:hypothetical protein
MIDEYHKQRSLIDPDRKIEVYRNLHKKCWSVRQNGLVKFHCNQVFLRDCKFVVQPAGRAKVLREKRKNVHAFVRGYLWDEKLPTDLPNIENRYVWDNVNYNPYKAATFVDDSNNPVHKAEFVDLAKEVVALQPT